mgnify:CR=1 FL=1
MTATTRARPAPGRRAAMLLVPAWLALVPRAALAEGPEAVEPPRLPPVAQRPVVVIDRIEKAGLLLPSVQETVKAAVLALNALMICARARSASCASGRPIRRR